jgi:hypothetical protein
MMPGPYARQKAQDRSYLRDLTGDFDINIESARTRKLKVAAATFEDCKISAVPGRVRADLGRFWRK